MADYKKHHKERIEAWIDHLRSGTPREVTNIAVSPITADKGYSEEESAFVMTMHKYIHWSGNKFPAWSEAFLVLKSLGYRKVEVRMLDRSRLELLIWNLEHIGDLFRDLRGAITQKEFARRIGITDVHLSHIESGKAMPSLDVLKKLSRATGEESLDDRPR